MPRLIKVIKKYNPDYIYQACAGLDTAIGAYIAKLLGIPFIYRVANDTDSNDRYKKLLPIHHRVGFYYGTKAASFILCQNKYQFNNFKKKVPNKKIKIFHNPFHVDENDSGIVVPRANREYIAWIGIFQYQKNLSSLYDIASKLSSVEFKIAGKATLGGVDEGTKAAIEKLERCDNVEFVGFLKHSEINKFLQKSIALLNTSRYEGFSNTFLEAFYAGTPVITTTKVDPDNIIRDNKLGYVCKNFRDLPSLVLKMVKNENYDVFSNKCRYYLYENHDSKKLAKQLLKFIES